MEMRTSNRLSPEYALLGFLYKKPGYGYELHLQLNDELGNIWHASQSQTYNILKRLEEGGFISATHIEQEKLPARQILHITEAGTERFESWLNRATKCSVHAIRVEFVTRLYFMQLYFPEKRQEMVQEQLEVVNSGLVQLKDNLARLPDERIFNRLALELRIELLDSAAGWIKRCGDELGRSRLA